MDIEYLNSLINLSFACSSTTILYQKYTACSFIVINVCFALVEVRDLILLFYSYKQIGMTKTVSIDSMLRTVVEK